MTIAIILATIKTINASGSQPKNMVSKSGGWREGGENAD